jgi:hypothetical protein
MSKVTFSARSAKGRVRNVSARPRLEQDESAWRSPMRARSGGYQETRAIR